MLKNVLPLTQDLWNDVYFWGVLRVDSLVALFFHIMKNGSMEILGALQ